MSVPSSPNRPSSRTATPSGSRRATIPRPPPSPIHPPSPSPSVSTLSAAAGGAVTPRRASTPTVLGHAAAEGSRNGASLGVGLAGVGAAGRPTTPTTEKPSKGRARDLLRKHYGLGVGPPPPSGKPMDPMDIDSPAFDAKSYYEQLITTSSLSTLLKKENELLTEIRQLDSERQSLVYNHHHELIAASDTIASMKTRADNLDVDLDKLKIAFSEISRLYDELTMRDEAKADDLR